MSLPDWLLDDPNDLDECEEHGTAFYHGSKCLACAADNEDMYADWTLQDQLDNRRKP